MWPILPNLLSGCECWSRSYGDAVVGVVYRYEKIRLANKRLLAKKASAGIGWIKLLYTSKLLLVMIL